MRSELRARCNWGDGDLPAPYAEGDIINIPEGAQALERMYGMEPGRYRITYGPSIDEGDAWYFRVTPARRMRKGEQREGSDRLHVAYAARSTWDHDVDWLAGCTLVGTADPAGLKLREAMIEAGWQLDESVIRFVAASRIPHSTKRLLTALDAELQYLSPSATAAVAELRELVKQADIP